MPPLRPRSETRCPLWTRVVSAWRRVEREILSSSASSRSGGRWLPGGSSPSRIAVPSRSTVSSKVLGGRTGMNTASSAASRSMTGTVPPELGSCRYAPAEHKRIRTLAAALPPDQRRPSWRLAESFGGSAGKSESDFGSLRDVRSTSPLELDPCSSAQSGFILEGFTVHRPWLAGDCAFARTGSSTAGLRGLPACRFLPLLFVFRVKDTERLSRHNKEDIMGRIVVTEFISLDGVIEAPGGAEDYKHGGWTFEIDRGEEGDKFKLDELMEAEAQLLGRVTYEGFAAAWPDDGRRGRLRREDERDAEVRRLLDPGAGRVEEHDRSSPATSPRRSPSSSDEVDGVILVAGSAQLVQGLIEHDLVDELRLMVFPVLLGRASASSPSRRQEAAEAGRLENGRRRRRDPDLRAGLTPGVSISLHSPLQLLTFSAPYARSAHLASAEWAVHRKSESFCRAPRRRPACGGSSPRTRWSRDMRGAVRRLVASSCCSESPSTQSSTWKTASTQEFARCQSARFVRIRPMGSTVWWSSRYAELAIAGG